MTCVPAGFRRSGEDSGTMTSPRRSRGVGNPEHRPACGPRPRGEYLHLMHGLGAWSVPFG